MKDHEVMSLVGLAVHHRRRPHRRAAAAAAAAADGTSPRNRLVRSRRFCVDNYANNIHKIQVASS